MMDTEPPGTAESSNTLSWFIGTQQEVGNKKECQKGTKWLSRACVGAAGCLKTIGYSARGKMRPALFCNFR